MTEKIKYITFGDLQEADQEVKQKQLQSDLNGDLSDLRSNDQFTNQQSTPAPNYPEAKTRGIRYPEAKTPRNLDSPTLENPEVKTRGSQNTPYPKAPVKGYFLPNWIDDELMPTLELVEQIILRRIIRLSLGFNRPTTDPVSMSKLAEKCNITETPIKKAIKSLENKGIIRVHRDLSGNKYAGGNKYELLVDDDTYGVSKTPRTKNTPKQEAHIKDHDHDFKITNHHQSEVMMIYKNLTGNDSWTKSDATAYEKIKHLPLQEISQLIKSVLEKAHQKPASLAYFVKAYQNPTQANPANKSAIKAKLAAIVERKREAHVGTRYTIADLTFDVKAECIREGISFDNDLFNDIIDKK